MNNYKPIPTNRSLLVLDTPEKEVRSKYYRQLTQLITTIGEWNVNIYALSKEWVIPQSTLQRWKEKVVAEKGVIDIDQVGNRIQENMLSNINMMQKTIHAAGSVHQKQQAVRAYNDTITTFTQFLEAYGYKGKVADKIEIDQKQVSVIFNDPYDKYPDIEAQRRERKKSIQANK